jgi:hypothetical protein
MTGNKPVTDIPQKKKRGYMVCTGNYVATPMKQRRKKKRGYTVCSSGYAATDTS